MSRYAPKILASVPQFPAAVCSLTGVSGGVFASSWSQWTADKPAATTQCTVFEVEGNNWRVSLIPQGGFNDGAGTWGVGFFVDLFAGDGVKRPGYWYVDNPSGIMFQSVSYPTLTKADMLGWCWCGVLLIPSATDGFTFKTFVQIGTDGTKRYTSTTRAYSLASCRTNAVANGMPQATADTWVPDTNIRKHYVGPYYETHALMEIRRQKLVAAASVPSDGVAFGNTSETADTSAIADWPFYWSGESETVNSGLVLTDQSGNGRTLSLVANAQFNKGSILPVSWQERPSVAGPLQVLMAQQKWL